MYNILQEEHGPTALPRGEERLAIDGQIDGQAENSPAGSPKGSVAFCCVCVCVCVCVSERERERESEREREREFLTRHLTVSPYHSLSPTFVSPFVDFFSPFDDLARSPKGSDPPEALCGGISKVNFQETLSSFGDKCQQNGSKNEQRAPRTSMGCPHVGPSVATCPLA